MCVSTFKFLGQAGRKDERGPPGRRSQPKRSGRRGGVGGRRWGRGANRGKGEARPPKAFHAPFWRRGRGRG